MSNPDERGTLGKRFHDLPTPSDNPDLNWEAMARHILPPELPEKEPQKKRLIFWWWFFGAGLLAVSLSAIWLLGEEELSKEPTKVPEIVAVADEEELDTSTTILPESLPVAANKASTLTQNDVAGKENAFPIIPLSKSAGLTEDRPEEKKTSPLFAETKQVTQAATAIRPYYEVTEVATLGILPLTVGDEGFESSAPELPAQVEKINKSAISLLVGMADFKSRYEGNAPWLTNEQNAISGQIAVRYQRALGANWFVSGGIDVRQYRFRTAFERVDTEARIYQPGTVDTIFRNITTGEDRVVTTDTVGGTRIRRFGNDNSVVEMGLPLLVGRRWAMGKHEFSIAAGPRLGILLNRNGRTLVDDSTVLDLEAAPQFSQSVRWSARLEAGYAFRLTPGISIMGALGGEAALSDWSNVTTLKQRPTLLNGQLGLRFSLK